ncbi:MAG: hypothetical protein COC19_04490 [SAR86 cluster bacterium]|uniref:CENP-V/GFA domain-containing protein n=1 Tax=SAR86 cluster bacterium TaxID=2030880 RepID=A0A2A4MN71_9GAMM|nr:MAG: hypothetical protein COC19_04490 [SAR86 cluster bacterium]
MEELQLKCDCGKVTGIVHDVKPGCGNRVVCYCASCRNFAKHVNPDGHVLNEFGGTEIFQIAPSSMEIQQGLDSIACLRLSEKGLYRWYASCCNTPIGNTVSLRFPLVGVISSFITRDQGVDSKIGPVVGISYEQYATGDLPQSMRIGKSKIAQLFTMIRKMLIWKVQGKHSPSPFYDKQGNPIVEPSIIKRP